MQTIYVHDILKVRVLMTRESARLLEEAMGVAIASGHDNPPADTVVVDFQGVEGMAPSFLDELIRVFEGFAKSGDSRAPRRLVVTHPPARLSLKFEAIARSHEMSIQPADDGAWVFERAA